MRVLSSVVAPSTTFVALLDPKVSGSDPIRRWVLKFGPAVARELRLARPKDNELNRGCRLRPSKVFHRSAIE